MNQVLPSPCPDHRRGLGRMGQGGKDREGDRQIEVQPRPRPPQVVADVVNHHRQPGPQILPQVALALRPGKCLGLGRAFYRLPEGAAWHLIGGRLRCSARRSLGEAGNHRQGGPGAGTPPGTLSIGRGKGGPQPDAQCGNRGQQNARCKTSPVQRSSLVRGNRLGRAIAPTFGHHTALEADFQRAQGDRRPSGRFSRRLGRGVAIVGEVR